MFEHHVLGGGKPKETIDYLFLLFQWGSLRNVLVTGADLEFFLSSFQFFYCNIRVPLPGGHFLTPTKNKKVFIETTIL